ncbi:MAG TPA: PIN domain-containing protein [Verrucomicrobiae bacterium]|nr:PIN domain-containing protein [Verrucomicrobiae bacterium]
MTLLVLRLCFLILCVLGSWSISQLHDEWALHPILAIVIGLAGGGAFIGIDKLLKGFSLRGLSAATFGLFVGFVISYFIGNSVLFKFIDDEPKLIAQIAMYVVCSYLAMVIALRGKDEFNLVIPYVKFMRENKPERLVLLDTNIIIDGRIQEVCLTGFLDAVLVVPRFVLAEVQYIADAADDVKRARGRRGLEVLKALQQNPRVEVKVHDNEVPEIKEVDAKLVQLAKMLPAEILTNDYNLNRIAELQHVKVLNLNELAKSVRPVVLPGERLTVRLVKEGREPQQAVAYLDDGTMIVVSRGRRAIGQEVEVTVTSVLQTAAGRMAFAELANGNGRVQDQMPSEERGKLAPVS